MSREEFLESLPVAPSFDPCRCTKAVPGYTLDPERNMWVCARCRKPSGMHRGYSPFCFECGQPFTYTTVPPVPERFPYCPACE